MPFFDTHAHYDSKAFQQDRQEVISALPQAGIGGVIDPGCELESSRMAVELSEQYPFFYAAVGVHPSDCGDFTAGTLSAIEVLCGYRKVVAIGEIGLDYYWKDNPPHDFQQKVFRQQLELAIEQNLPVIVHCRDAIGDCLDIVRDYPKARGVFHCFSGSPEVARELLDMGWYLGFDGPITYKNARRSPEVAAITPLDRILLETDSPYLTPVPFRGKRNDSRNLVYINAVLAGWKGVSPEELEEITWNNALRLFHLEA